MGAKRNLRANVYVDGFNLYRGALKGTAFKWLNLETYFDRIRTHDTIQQVHYFTAVVASGVEKQNRQKIYLQALAALPRVNVVEGNYKKKTVVCTVRDCHHHNRLFSVPEEKRTDVNIALQMLDDAYRDLCDLFVLVSGDSDLVPAIKTIKLRFPQKKVFVYVPTPPEPNKRWAHEIRSSADKSSDLPSAIFGHCQLPDPFPLGNGVILRRPSSW